MEGGLHCYPRGSRLPVWVQIRLARGWALTGDKFSRESDRSQSNSDYVHVCIIIISELKAFTFKVGRQFTIGKKFLNFFLGHVMNTVTKVFMIRL